MKFNKIVCVDETKLNKQAISELQNFSREKVEVYTDYPESEEEIIQRIGDAEAVIVSWHTKLEKAVIKACPNIRYIGMACSLYDDESANVSVEYAREQGITVTGIEHYGDKGVPEFIISELIQLLNGYSGLRWKEMPVELTGLKIGIIGFGVTGQLLAECLKPFGAEIFYFSKTRKPEWEKKQVTYLDLPDLLNSCNVISLHLPRNIKLMGSEEFHKLGSGKILINTSLGLPFDCDAFENWIKASDNFAIFDGDGKNDLPPGILEIDRVITREVSAGWSSQTRERLSEKVLQNIEKYFDQEEL